MRQVYLEELRPSTEDFLAGLGTSLSTTTTRNNDASAQASKIEFGHQLKARKKDGGPRFERDELIIRNKVLQGNQ